MVSFLRNLLLVLVLSLTYNTTFAKEGFKIKVKIDGYSDSTLLLTSYFGEKIKLVDTAYNEKSGNYIFSGDTKLPGGIYMIVSSSKKKLFEFIVGKNQYFSMNTDTINYIQNMKVSNSKENEVFFSYLITNEDFYLRSKHIKEEIDSLLLISAETLELENLRDSLNQEIIEYKVEVINQNEGLFVSSLLNSMRDVDIPDSIINSPDSTLTFLYYKEHYWDNLDVSDSCLLRSPVFMRKIKLYFSQVVVFNPDSVIVAIDTVISKARPSQEVVGYLVWHFISEYQNPKFMGFDKVFVHLVDEYFSKETIANTTPSIQTSLEERANKIRPILLNQQAPDMILIDSLGALRTFRSITNEYTILFFWDSECGICGKEIIELQKTYDNPDYDIEVFSINVNSDLDSWKTALNKKKVPGINVNGTRSATEDFHDLYDIYGTPVIYVLDKDKNIIAKRIGADKLEEFLDNYEKLK